MPKLTIKRAHSTDPICLNVHVSDPAFTKGGMTGAMFDTGNDHTVISKYLADAISLPLTSKTLSVQGVTGGAVAQTAMVTIGIGFDGGHKVTITNHEVAVMAGPTENVLIGRDFLERFDVTITRDGTFTLSC